MSTRNLGIYGSVALAAVVALAAAAPAAAEDDLGTIGGLTYVSGTNPMAAGAVMVRSATCPEPFSHLIGGTADSDDDEEFGFWLESYPTDAGDSDSKPDDSWFMRAQESLGLASSVTSWAICGFDPTKYPSKSAQLGPSKMKTVGVRCPSKTRVTSGGLSANGSNNALISDSYPFDAGDKGKVPDDGWRARVLNRAGATEQITVHAICVKGVKTSYSSFTADMAANSTTSVSPSICPENGYMTGGGAKLTPEAARITAGIPFDTIADGDSVPDDRLSVEARNPDSEPGRFKVTFACLLRP